MPLPQPVDVSPRAGRFRRKAPEIPQTDAILEGLIGEPNAQNMRIPCEAAALGGYMGFDLPPAFRLRSANRLADRVFGLGTISLEARQSRCGLFRVVEKLACVIRSQSRTGVALRGDEHPSFADLLEPEKTGSAADPSSTASSSLMFIGISRQPIVPAGGMQCQPHVDGTPAIRRVW